MAERYSLKPYQSVYKDQQGVAINSLLRQRYEQAFASDDAIGGAVDNMQSTNFEGDLALKSNLANKTREELMGRAERADYETMGMDSIKSARSFAKGYKPIEQNLAALTAYQQKLQASYDDGDITAETLAGRMAQSTHNYSGLQTDENGEVIEDSFFRGKSFVKDKDFSVAMKEAMSDFAMEKGGTKTRRVGQQVEGQEGEFEIMIDNQWERVSQEDVRTVFLDVLADPDMQASLNQQAQLRTFNMTDEDIQTNLLTNLNGDPEDPESTGGLRGLLQTAINEGDEEEAENIQKLIDQAETMLQGDGTETPEEMVERRRQFVEQEVKNQEVQRELGTAYSKYIVNNRWTDDSITHDDKWMAGYKQRLADHVETLAVPLDYYQTDNPGGNTSIDINNYITGLDAERTGVVADFNNLEAIKNIIESGDMGAGFTGFTEEDILSGNVPESVKQILKTHQDKIKSFHREKDIQNKLLIEANASSAVMSASQEFANSTIKSSLRNNDLVVTGAQVIDEARRLLGRPDLTVAEFGELMSLAHKEKYKSQSSGFPFADPTDNTTGPAGAAAYKLLHQLDNWYGGQGGAGITGSNWSRQLSEAGEVHEVSIDAYLKENAKRQVSGMGETTAPGINDDAIQKTTKAFTQYFVGKPLDRSLNIGWGGNLNTGTGTIGSFRDDVSSKGGLGDAYTKLERASWAEGNIEVVDVLFNTAPGPDGGGITLKVTNELGATAQVYVSRANFANTALSQQFNSVEWRTGEAKNRAKNKGLDNYTYKLGNGGTMMFDFTQSGGDYVTFTSATGESKSMLTTDPEFQIRINDYDADNLLPF